MRYIGSDRRKKYEDRDQIFHQKQEGQHRENRPLEEEAEQLILVNAMYAANVDEAIKEFLRGNKDKIKCVININSSASGSSTYKAVKKVCDECQIPLSEKEFHTAASWIFINKGRPNEEDFKRLEEFLNTIKE